MLTIEKILPKRILSIDTSGINELGVNTTHVAYFVHEELYTSSLQNIIDNFLHYYFHREK